MELRRVHREERMRESWKLSRCGCRGQNKEQRRCGVDRIKNGELLSRVSEERLILKVIRTRKPN